MAYSCFFSLGRNLDFPEFLQKSFITSITGVYNFCHKRYFYLVIFLWALPIWYILLSMASSMIRLGDFWMFSVANFLTKVAQILDDFWGFFRKTSILSKNCWGYFLVNFWMYLVNFLFQHLVTLKLRYLNSKPFFKSTQTIQFWI